MTTTDHSRDIRLDVDEDDGRSFANAFHLSSPLPSSPVLSVIQVSEGDGEFILRAALTSESPGVTVDIARGALGLRSGRISRWVPLPEDALVDQAVIVRSEESLTVTIPERERRSRRNIVHVW
jgi:hypothetical protein